MRNVSSLPGVRLTIIIALIAPWDKNSGRVREATPEIGSIQRAPPFQFELQMAETRQLINYPSRGRSAPAKCLPQSLFLEFQNRSNAFNGGLRSPLDTRFSRIIQNIRK